MNNHETRWGLIGASTIASQWMIGAIRAQEGHSITSVLSTDASRGADFAASREVGSSTTSLSEMLNGRFLVDTEISSASQKQEVYRQLFLRGGIVISMDSTGDYYFLDPSGDRISLNELDASIVDLDHYALHRPRNISPVDYTYLSRSIESGDDVFLVMPNHFESGIFASIEKVLPAPLDQFSNASITVGVSRNGHLDFTLHSVVGNDGTTIQSGHSIRGL